VSLPRFIVPPGALSGRTAVVSGPSLHHFHVRRLRSGRTIILSDGSGLQRHGVIVSIDRHRAIVELRDEAAPERESPLRLVLAQALLKKDKLEWAIEKATELGATEIVVFASQRTVRRASSGRTDRWHRIARSAAQQSQRSTVPAITGPVLYSEVTSRHSEDLPLLFSERGNATRLAAVQQLRPRASSILAVVGPEGGFDRDEVGHALAAGFHAVGLGPRILRAETAAVAAVTLCQFLWGDLQAPAP